MSDFDEPQINAQGAYLLLTSNYRYGRPLSTAAKCFSLFIDELSGGCTLWSYWLIISDRSNHMSDRQRVAKRSSGVGL